MSEFKTEANRRPPINSDRLSESIASLMASIPYLAFRFDCAHPPRPLRTSRVFMYLLNTPLPYLPVISGAFTDTPYLSFIRYLPSYSSLPSGLS